MRLIVCDDYRKLSETAARLILGQVVLKPDSVLGLATGSTPIGMYKCLSKMCKNGEIDFSEVVSFNLDEYYKISKENDQSYDFFMNSNFFSHINIKRENTYILDGQAKDPERECQEYERKIALKGGIDFQVLGIGVNGHIGFNEPGKSLVASTHITNLTQSTIDANSRFFKNKDEVPKQALTMGMSSILKSKKIMLLASGKNKHNVVEALLTDEITTSIPATFLKIHPDVVLICDAEAYNG